MTRFKELRRIEAAIAHKDEREIHWAMNYCRTRLNLATLKQHIKHWQGLIDRLEKTKLGS